MSINIPLLKQICEIAGIPGFEKRIRDLVIKEVAPLVDEWTVDNLGNVITRRIYRARGGGHSGGKEINKKTHAFGRGFSSCDPLRVRT